MNIEYQKDQNLNITKHNPDMASTWSVSFEGVTSIIDVIDSPKETLVGIYRRHEKPTTHSRDKKAVETEALLSNFDTDGQQLWSLSIRCSADLIIEVMHSDSKGHLVTGHFSGDLTIGDQSLFFSQNVNTFKAWLDHQGQLIQIDQSSQSETGILRHQWRNARHFLIQTIVETDTGPNDPQGGGGQSPASAASHSRLK